MKVLVIGSGGREHALCWKISQSHLVHKMFCAPGNSGIGKIASNIDISPTNLNDLMNFVKNEAIDLTVVGPEAPLVAGIVDLFREQGLQIFGPDKKSSQLEGSKVFAKSFLRKYGIPTASFKSFEDPSAAIGYLKTTEFPVVVKADGLAAGKGAVTCFSHEESVKTVKSMMVEKIFGEAGKKVIIEEFLTGFESSVMAILDGKSILVLENSKDYKRIYDNDLGPNTGGMGSYSPVTSISKQELNKVISKILVPVMHGLKRENIIFKGVLYAGIMFTKFGPKVLEFNVRFGDPETQTLLVRLKSDIVPLMLASIEEKLDQIEVVWSEQSAVCVVMTSGGYPGKYDTGMEISGLDLADEIENSVVFHAGTSLKDVNHLTAGGRVLNVVGIGDTMILARETSYKACSKILFKNQYYRRDIALKC